MRTKSPSQNIPSLDNLYDVTREYVKEHQGEKGYIDTNSNLGNDLIFAIIYDYYNTDVHEVSISKVRVNENNDLEIMVDYNKDWDCVRYSDTVLFIPTIYSIAESIEEYVEDCDTDNLADTTDKVS